MSSVAAAAGAAARTCPGKPCCRSRSRRPPPDARLKTARPGAAVAAPGLLLSAAPPSGQAGALAPRGVGLGAHLPIRAVAVIIVDLLAPAAIRHVGRVGRIEAGCAT